MSLDSSSANGGRFNSNDSSCKNSSTSKHEGIFKSTKSCADDSRSLVIPLSSKVILLSYKDCF